MPDGVSIPTSTFCLTRKVAITSDVDGNFDTILTPTLASSVWSTRGNIANGATVYAGNPAAGGPVATSGNALAFDVSSLSNNFVRYRIVGWGARFRATAGTSIPGEVVAAPMALKGLLPMNSGLRPSVEIAAGSTTYIPSYGWANVAPDTVGQLLGTLGVPSTGVGNAAKVNLDALVVMPRHGVVTASQASARGLHFRSKPFEPESESFKQLSYTATGTDSIDFWDNGSGVSPGQQYGVNLDPWKVNGWESIVVGGSGFYPSSGIGSLEVIYHCEAVYNYNQSLTLPRASANPSPTDSTEYDRVRQHIAKLASVSFADVVQQGEDYVLGQVEGAVGSALSSGLGSVSGMLTRMLSLGA